MKLYQVKINKPNSYYNDYEELSEWDLEKLPEFEIGWYWYAAGCYEGSGQLLVKKDGKWYLNSLGHCSCYGPMEHLDFSEKSSFETLAQIETKLSTDYYFEDVLPLITVAREAGFE